MEQERRNQLDVELKKMIKHFDQAEDNRNRPRTQFGTGNGIRRREGEKDKRFSIQDKGRAS